MKGLKNFRNDLDVMIGKEYTKKSVYYIWCFLWSFLSPCFCFVTNFAFNILYLRLSVKIFCIFKLIGIFSFTKFKTIKIGDYILPDWTFYIGETMQILVLTGLFGVAITLILKNKFVDEKVCFLLLNSH